MTHLMIDERIVVNYLVLIGNHTTIAEALSSLTLEYEVEAVAGDTVMKGDDVMVYTAVSLLLDINVADTTVLVMSLLQTIEVETGIAGYTLVYHSRGFQLVQHEPFTSMEDAIKRGTDIKSITQIVEMSNRRMLVADTDIGCELRKQIEDLKELLYAYRHGFIKESERKK